MWSSQIIDAHFKGKGDFVAFMQKKLQKNPYSLWWVE